MQTNKAVKLLLLFCSLYFLPQFSFAQEETKTFYYIQLGLFRYPDTLQFSPLNSLGKIYQEPAENNLTRILLGKYSDRNIATEQQKESIIKMFCAEYTSYFLVFRSSSARSSFAYASCAQVA